MTILNTLEQMVGSVQENNCEHQQKKSIHTYQMSTDKKMIEGEYHNVSAVIMSISSRVNMVQTPFDYSEIVVKS